MAKDIPIKIATKKGRKANFECVEELTIFFTCMKKFNGDVVGNCDRERKALTACATAAAKKPKTTNTINYHLQRISRLMK